MPFYPIHTVDSAPAASRSALSELTEIFGFTPNLAGVMAASLLGLGLPIAGFMARQIAAEIDREGLVVAVRRHARRVATRWRCPSSPRRYVVFGHTHRPETSEWARADRAIVYLNPGAWLPRMDAPDGGAAPRFVWLARRGGAYVRHRLFSLAAVAR